MADDVYALLGPDDRAINFVAWDGQSKYDYGAEQGYKLVKIPPLTSYDYGWRWNGSTFVDDSAPPPPAVPESVTPRQVRLLLLGQGLLEQVEGMIAASDKATQITWEFASEFRRDNPLLLALAKNLNLTEAQIDEFFIAAAAI